MDRRTAKILVTSLVGRLAQKGGKYRLPSSILSADEVAALTLLAGVHARAVSAPLEKLEQHVELVLPTNAEIAAAPGEDQRRLCIDFGTAMSKAWVSGVGASDTYPLVLGRSAGTGDYLPLPSSVYIANGGRIFFGAAAETQQRQESDTKRVRFDNLKRMLSDAEVDQDLYSVPLDVGVDPTGSGLTKGDLLVLYLGWFTDMALIANSAMTIRGRRKNAVGERLIRRRFAIPCFEDASAETFGSGRARWARIELSRALRRAQVVADTLHGKWGTLDVHEAKATLEAIKSLPDKALPDVLVSSPSIREPVAAGASIVGEQLELLSSGSGILRQHVLVIDAGAGTTDFAMFLARRVNELDPIKYSLIAPSVRLSRVAGNEFDDILRNVVLKACGIDPKDGSPRSEEDFGIIKRQLSATIRNIKQELFTSELQKASVKLPANAKGQVTLSTLMAHRRMKSAAKELAGIVQEILESVFTEKVVAPLSLRRERVSVHVLLTGGSSQVGIIKELASARFHVNGVDVILKELSTAPTWINRLDRDLADLVSAAYPQCAVAIGGSSPEMPEELAELGGLIDTPIPGRRVVERFQSGGI